MKEVLRVQAALNHHFSTSPLNLVYAASSLGVNIDTVACHLFAMSFHNPELHNFLFCVAGQTRFSLQNTHMTAGCLVIV